MKIRVSEVKVGKRLRPKLGQQAVADIAKAFKAKGQRRAIIVRIDRKRPRLVAGARRLAAAKLLGWSHIEATPLDLTGLSREMVDIEAEIAEIDDNFPRSKLRLSVRSKGKSGPRGAREKGTTMRDKSVKLRDDSLPKKRLRD